MKKIMAKHLDLSDGRRRLNIRSYIDDVMSRGNNWFIKELKKLNAADRRMGYLVLKDKIREMGEILNLGYYNPRMQPDDQIFIKPDNLRDFDKFYDHFFKDKNSIKPNNEIWFFDVDKGIEAWMKYNFLMGVHLIDLQKRNIIPIVSLYEDDLRELGLNNLK